MKKIAVIFGVLLAAGSVIVAQIAPGGFGPGQAPAFGPLVNGTDFSGTWRPNQLVTESQTAAGGGSAAGADSAVGAGSSAGAGRIARNPGIDAQRSRARSVASRSAGSNGPLRTPSSVMIPVMSSAGVTSKAGLRTSVPGGAMRTPRNSRTSSGLRSSMTIAEPSGVARSTEDVGCADVERDAVARREHGQRIGADLVGGVAVGGHAVRPDQDDVHLAE